MITNLKERRANLLSQLDELQREITIYKQYQYKELTLCLRTVSVEYDIPDRLVECLIN